LGDLTLVVCDAGWFAGFVAGIRRFVFVLNASPVGVFAFCAGIRVTVFAVQALPLCGAAPTFLCRRKEK